MSRQCAGDKRSSEELFFKHRKIIDETYYITPRKAVLNICYGLEKVCFVWLARTFKHLRV
jgi:hypothetical protein